MVTTCFTAYRLLSSCSLDCCEARQAAGVGGWVVKNYLTPVRGGGRFVAGRNVDGDTAAALVGR